MKKKIEILFNDSINVKNKILKLGIIQNLLNMGLIASKAIQNGKKILICGNGGSAADAQHLAAEMLIRLRPYNNRQGIPAISLAQDPSTMTACGNDFGYDYLFERMVETLGHKGDILIAISTSGNSKNIINAMKAARLKGIHVFGLLGCEGGAALRFCDESFVVPSNNTGRIQESHITAGHALMELIEDQLISSGFIKLK